MNRNCCLGHTNSVHVGTFCIKNRDYGLAYIDNLQLLGPLGTWALRVLICGIATRLIRDLPRFQIMVAQAPPSLVWI